MPHIDCPECLQPMWDSLEHCPHCHRPGRSPVVAMASRADEKQKLEERYQVAKQDYASAGLEARALDYEKVVDGSTAVITRSFNEVMRLCYSQDEVYTTFYQRANSGQLVSSNESWDRCRAIADNILFGDQIKVKVRFAALTLTNEGLPHYGDCSLVLRTDMIAHRTSVFEENSVVFIKQRNISSTDDSTLPAGHRAVRNDRSKLAVIKASVAGDDFSGEPAATLMKSGVAGGIDDVFIEVHIFGDITIRSFAHVTIRPGRAAPSDAEYEVVRENLERYTIGLTVQKNPCHGGCLPAWATCGRSPKNSLLPGCETRKTPSGVRQ